MIYIDLFKKLEENNVRYLLCGGLAVSIYGIPRSTADIDLLIDFDKTNLEKFISVMELLKYNSNVPVDLNRLFMDDYRKKLSDEKNMIALSFVNQITNVVHVDILIKIPFSFNDIWHRKNERTFKDLKIQLISPEDLISMKEISNRNQDKQDIVQLLKLINK